MPVFFLPVKSLEITSTNTAGYYIEVYKGNGQKVSFSLDGFDNTSFKVLLGTNIDRSNVNFALYRLDIDYKMESRGL